MLNGPNLATRMFGMTRPAALAPFKIAIYQKKKKIRVRPRSLDKIKQPLYSVKSQLRGDAILDGIKLEKKYGVIQAREDEHRSAGPENGERHKNS